MSGEAAIEIEDVTFDAIPVPTRQIQADDVAVGDARVPGVGGALGYAFEIDIDPHPLAGGGGER